MTMTKKPDTVAEPIFIDSTGKEHPMSAIETARVHAIAEPAPAPMDPPHGGSWRRHEDGSLELLHNTQPASGRRGAESPASTAQHQTEE